jgi:uncharacterized protein YdeI (YjbR/CyaY-like superfamily)
MPEPSRPRHFASAAAFGKWLADNHARRDELWVAFYKKHTGKAGMSYPEAVDEALCHGWIDGIKKRLDDESFTHRFTPRRARSIWSDINLRRAEALIASGRMQPAGMAAYEARTAERSGIYSFEGKAAQFDATTLAAFQAGRRAWAFFAAQPPGYRRIAAHWVMSAKREETRARRLAQLMEDSVNGRRLAQFETRAVANAPAPRKKP